MFTTSRATLLEKAIPYGIYDLAANDGFVSVGVDLTTPVFAVTSIKAWWKQVGSKRYPNARENLHHGRWRRQQRLPLTRLEAAASARCR